MMRTMRTLGYWCCMLMSAPLLSQSPAKARELSAEEKKEVGRLREEADRKLERGKFAEAAKTLQALADYRAARQGESHWEVVSARWSVKRWQRSDEQCAEVLRSSRLISEGVQLLGNLRHREAEAKMRQALGIYRKVLGEHPDIATSYNNLAVCLVTQGNYVGALPLLEKALTIQKRTLGEQHPDTARSYHNLAARLDHLSRYAEALPLYQKALAIRKRVLGEQHPNTASSYNGLGLCLNQRSKYGEALPLLQKALTIRQEAQGEQHPDTAESYNNVGLCLYSLGNPTEALPLLKKALNTWQKVLGGQHPHAVRSYNNVASCLKAHGKYAEALPLFHKALIISQNVWGEQHADTAVMYHNLAGCLCEQGRHAEALPLYQNALGIDQKVLGELHADTAACYNGLGLCLTTQGKHSEALPLHQKASGIDQKVLGEQHPNTASSYQNLAFCLNSQRKHAEALPLYQKALAIRRKVQGEQHPNTAQRYNNLAACLHDQGKLADALGYFEKAILGCEFGRLQAASSGFEGALVLADVLSPRAALASCLVQLANPEVAWMHAESDLARGLLDDRLPSVDMTADGDSFGRLLQIDHALLPLLGRAMLEAQQEKQRVALTKERDGILAELAQFAVERSRARLLPRDRIQKQIPAGAAIVFWLDVLGHHLGCVLRLEGPPVWVKLPGSECMPVF